MLRRGRTDALFIVKRKQEEYKEKDKKLLMCFVDLEKAFDRVPRKVKQWALRMKRLPEILVKAVMSLYEGSKTKVKVGSEFSEKFWLVYNIRDLFCTFVVCDCGVCCDRECKRRLNKEVLYVDDLVLDE